LHRLTDWASARDLELAAISVTRPTLEDVYLELVGEQPAAPARATAVRSGLGATGSRR
jgi:hypothetical protein